MSGQHSFLNPSTFFSLACVAVSAVAATTIWRNHSRADAEASSFGALESSIRLRPQPRRRKAVDSLYGSPDDQSFADSSAHENGVSPGPTDDFKSAGNLTTLVQRCNALSHTIRSLQFTGSLKIVTSSLQAELSLLSISFSQMQQSGLPHLDHSASACLETTTNAILDILGLVQTELESPYVGTPILQECLQQLRDQRPAVEFLQHSARSSPHHQLLTPPAEVELESALDSRRLTRGGFLAVPSMPSSTIPTGLTPCADTPGWIEPPPEYAPPADSVSATTLAPSEEKRDAKQADMDPPEPQDQASDEVFDTDVVYNAVTENNEPLIVDLLDQGADVNASVGELQRTALHQAAYLNNQRCLSLLIRHGAEISAEDAKGDTPLHLAAWTGHVEALATFLSHGADVDWLSGRDAYSPLWCAISAHHIDAARLLLKHGARVSLRSAASDNGLLPLHQAAITSQTAMCELLLERGALVDAPDDEGNTALHYAATSGSASTVHALLRAGADVNLKQSQGLTPAHWAAHKGHEEVLLLLLSHGALVNARGNANARPLHLAANRGHTSAVRILLEKGADWSKEAVWDGVQGTPARIARLKGHAGAAALIDKYAC
ncbi:hypothetical protein D0863_06704 [Hortaea werneckii]|uniref:Uncharacterized protein n=1 Tax=Hortaea werneckii TaxID=91943 RepID=A0A3M7DXD6_HORWE|nr:hypothetical protein D0863_06704 [Hortaea werneckii]